MIKRTVLIILILMTGKMVNAQNNAYGDNQKEMAPGIFAIYSGDINQDGVIDITDQADLSNDLSNFAFGYINTDLNGDSVVDISDQSILDNNLAAFIGVVSPANGNRIYQGVNRNVKDGADPDK
jgi:hypothetical protein